MDKQELKRLGEKIVDGGFKDLIEVLQKGSGCLKQKQALYLIVCCCTTCNSNINNCDKLNGEDLISCLRGLSGVIENVTTEEYDNYLQSIFFICKLLIKKSFSLVPEIKNEILPRFTPKILVPKQKKVYKSICDLIQNEIVRLATAKLNPNEQKIISLGHLMSEIIDTALDGTMSMQYMFKYGLCLSYLKISLDVQYDFFLQNIKKIKELDMDDPLDGVSQLLKFGIYLFSSYLSQAMLKYSFECIGEILRVMPKDKQFIDLRELLKICKYLIDPDCDINNLVASRDILLKLIKTQGRSDIFQLILKLLIQVMNSFSNCCNSHNNKLFTDPEKHLIVYEMIFIMVQFYTKTHVPCTGDCKCLSKSTQEIFDLILCTMILFSINLNTNDLSKDYIGKVKHFLKKYFEVWASQKSKGCKAYKKYWCDVLPYLHNLGVVLFRKENHDETLSFTNMILRHHSVLGVLQDGVILPNIFNLLSSVYLKQKKYKEALIWTAIEIINTTNNNRKKVFGKWIKIKSMSKDENSPDIQEFTVISITKAIPSEYLCYIKQIESEEFQIELLLSELEIYYSHWKSKLSMMSSFRHLCQIADKETIMKAFVYSFTDEDMRVHEVVLELLNSVFKDISEKNNDETLMLYFAFYCLFLYRHEKQEMISKNLDEMERIKKLNKNSEKLVDVIPVDPLDQCDVVSVYKNLKLDGGKLEKLVMSLTILEGIFFSNLSPVVFRRIEPRKVFDLAMNIVMEFIIHSDDYNALRSLFLAYTLAEFLDDKYLLLECCGYFLRYLNISDLMVITQGLLTTLDESEQGNKYMMQYHINSSYFYLSQKEFSLAHTHYSKAKIFFESLKAENGKHSWCFEVDMELLLFKLAHSSSTMKLESLPKMTYAPLMQAFKIILDRYKTEPHWTIHSMIILLEVLDTLVVLHHDLRMPREVRYYGRLCLTLAQQHVLPVYSARILSYLAYADIWGERYDDCRVKLDGISDILLLDKVEKHYECTTQKPSSTVNPVDDIMFGIKEIMLDVPTQSYFSFQSAPESPVLQSQAYSSPLFLTHYKCKCFHCTSLKCRKIVFSRYYLEALWFMHKGQVTIADSYFKGIFKLHESLIKGEKDRFKFFYMHVSNHSNTFICLSENRDVATFDEILIYACVSYIKFLTNSGAKEAAKKCCENSLKRFDDAKIHYPHLYGEMLLQKIGLMCNFKESNNEVVSCTTLNNEDNIKIKTPEQNVKNIPLLKMKSPRNKKFVQPKVIKFNLSDSSNTPLKSTDNANATTKTPNILMIPPSLRNINTPKLKTPSRKKILSDKSNELDSSEKHSSKNEKTEDHTVKSKDNTTNIPKLSKPSRIATSLRNLDYAKTKTSNRKGVFTEVKKSDSLKCYPNDDVKTRELHKSASSERKLDTVKLEEKTRLLTSRLKKRNESASSLSNTNQVNDENDIQVVRRSRRNQT